LPAASEIRTCSILARSSRRGRRTLDSTRICRNRIAKTFRIESLRRPLDPLLDAKIQRDILTAMIALTLVEIVLVGLAKLLLGT
jgi:hypothetical protein